MNATSLFRLPSPQALTLVIIDIQEKLLPAIFNQDEVEKNCAALARGVGLLGGSIIVTEQYVKGLGPTVEPISDAAEGHPFIEKRAFSAWGCQEFVDELGEVDSNRVLIFCGIETHVCVMQSVLDAIEAGWNVGVVVDGVGSRVEANRELALRRMEQVGIAMLSTEMILFDLIRTSEHPNFKDILKIVK